ncbi:MAG: DUF3800 domain-containing protein [Candidatus Marinimicrobia bacterium]|nr:DUF3800 domain-containing protein [Candidatus Neomarinimicrobiota bacterium]
MNLCYLDESGTSAVPGNTSHFILAGLAVPVEFWKKCDKDISKLKKKWKIEGNEIHTAWMLRKYIEQKRISKFENMTYDQRRAEVKRFRTKELYRLQRSNSKQYHQTKKNYKQTEAYVHLTFNERKKVIEQFSKIIGGWGFARLFAECIDKTWFDPSIAKKNIDAQAFEQIVSRYEHYLQLISQNNDRKIMGMLIHDNNPTIAQKLTTLMVDFHQNGTLWTKIKNIIETPLFVDSQLTSMVQAADMCSYALRRYFENNEDWLLKNIFDRADRKDDKIVGVRHFSDASCQCMICQSR